MIVIGVDVHKQSVTAVAIDVAGRMLDEKTAAAGSDELLTWAVGLADERRWALEDCRRLTRWLERQLLAAGERLVRVSPKLMAPERRAGRGRGKSDAIDALAVARAALREPTLSGPRADEHWRKAVVVPPELVMAGLRRSERGRRRPRRAGEWCRAHACKVARSSGSTSARWSRTSAGSAAVLPYSLVVLFSIRASTPSVGALSSTTASKSR